MSTMCWIGEPLPEPDDGINPLRAPAELEVAPPLHAARILAVTQAHRVGASFFNISSSTRTENCRMVRRLVEVTIVALRAFASE